MVKKNQNSKLKQNRNNFKNVPEDTKTKESQIISSQSNICFSTKMNSNSDVKFSTGCNEKFINKNQTQLEKKEPDSEVFDINRYYLITP